MGSIGLFCFALAIAAGLHSLARTGTERRSSGSQQARAASPLCERRASGDPRRSILERYGDQAGYVAAIEAAARALVEQGLMLEEDVARCVAEAADWGRPRHDVKL